MNPTLSLLNRRMLAFVWCIAAVSSAAYGGEGLGIGLLEPRVRVVFSSEFSLPILRVLPRVGDAFNQNDVLIEFDSSLARVNLEANQAEERAARVHHESMLDLASAKQITPVELEMATRDHALATAKRIIAERELAATVLRAPFAGRVAERHVQDYEWAARGLPLLTVVDDTLLEVRFILPETSFPLAKVGRSVRITVPAVSGRAEAVISRVGAVFDPASRTFDVWAEVDNADGKYRAGMTAEVDVSGLVAGSGGDS